MFTHHISPVKICSFLCFPIPRSSCVHSVPCSHQHAMSLLWLGQTPTPARTMSKVSSWSRSWLHSQGLWEDLNNVLDIHLSIYMTVFLLPFTSWACLIFIFPIWPFSKIFPVPFSQYPLQPACWPPWLNALSCLESSLLSPLILDGLSDTALWYYTIAYLW